MIDVVYRHTGQKETVIFCDRIMALGFSHAFRAGISFARTNGHSGYQAERSSTILRSSRRTTSAVQRRPHHPCEKYKQVVDAWAKATDRVAEEMMKRISAVEKDDQRPHKRMNSIYMMSHSGARGSPAQMKAARRHAGLNGQAVGRDHRKPDHFPTSRKACRCSSTSTPTHGARKGLADTALKTAQLGLPDAASGRRGTGLHRHRAGLRHDQRPEDAGGDRLGHGGGLAWPSRPRPHGGGRRGGAGDRQSGDPRRAGPIDERDVEKIRGGQRPSVPHPVGADLRTKNGVCAKCLRARSCRQARSSATDDTWRRPADVEGAHGELRTRLADRLGRMTPTASPRFTRTGGKIAPVALGTHPFLVSQVTPDRMRNAWTLPASIFSTSRSSMVRPAGSPTLCRSPAPPRLPPPCGRGRDGQARPPPCPSRSPPASSGRWSCRNPAR